MKIILPKINIAVFLWGSATLVLVVFVAVCMALLFRMHEMGEKASTVREVKLPEVGDTQRALINLESLRRLAELVYITDDPQLLRRANVNAQALMTESVFISSRNFHERFRFTVAQIGTLVASKNKENIVRQRLIVLEKTFLGSLYSMLTHVPGESDKERILNMASSITFFKATVAFVSNNSSALLEKQISKDNAFFVDLQHLWSELVLREPALESFLRQQKELHSDYMNVARDLTDRLNEAFVQWQSIDSSLREMRDVIRTDVEFEITDALTSIEAASQNSVATAALLVAIGIVFLLMYLALLHMLLVRPIRWVGQKLLEIQHGNTNKSTHTMHIIELKQVGDLLDRFSVHLAELTSQASQFAEDAAEKQNIEALMGAVFKVSVEGYCVWAPGKSLIVNPELLHILDYEQREDIEEQFLGLVNAPLEKNVSLYDKVLQDGFFRREYMLQSSKGTLIPFEISCLPLQRQDGTHVFFYFRDLRQQKHTEEVLRTAKDRAEEAARVKSEFLARMSHEIRTPMNGVLGLTLLGLKDSPPLPQKNCLEKIQGSARILLGVINDILDFSKMENGNFTLESRPFTLEKMLDIIKNMLEPQALAKGLSFSIELDSRLPEYIVGDELRLSQILLNLCGNGLKFTESGGVSLNVLVEKEEEDHLQLRFSVVDSGLGMSERQQEILFRPFVQADTSTTRKYGGTGLGLVISKFLVEMMQGKIEIHSQLGKGSIFSFTVLVGKYTGVGQEEALPHRVEQRDLAALRGMRVLLAEDNEINQEIAVSLLEELGCSLLVASTGVEAVDFLRTHDVDCVLMDIQMPEMDGLTATRIIRQDKRESVRKLPIIAMTAHAMQEDRQKSLDCGMNGHITKPIDYDELCQSLLTVATARP